MKNLYLTGTLPDTPNTNQFGITRATLEVDGKYYPLMAYGNAGSYLAAREKGSTVSICAKKVVRPEFTEYVVQSFNILPPVRQPSQQVLVKLWARAAFQLNKGLKQGSMYAAVRDFCKVWGDPPGPRSLWINYFGRLERFAQPGTPLMSGSYDFLQYETRRMLDLLYDAGLTTKAEAEEIPYPQ